MLGHGLPVGVKAAWAFVGSHKEERKGPDLLGRRMDKPGKYCSAAPCLVPKPLCPQSLIWGKGPSWPQQGPTSGQTLGDLGAQPSAGSGVRGWAGRAGAGES